MSDFDLEAELNDDSSVGTEAEDRKHVVNNKLTWFKGEKDYTYRMSLLYFNPIELVAAMGLKAAAEKAGKTVTKEQLLAAANLAVAKRAEELSKKPEELQLHDKLDLSRIRFKKVKYHYKEGVGYVTSRLGLDGKENDAIWHSLGDQKTCFCTIPLIYPTNRQGEVVKERLGTDWKVLPWRAHSKIYEAIIDESESLKANDLSIATQDFTAKCTNVDYQNFTIKAAGKALWRRSPQFQALVLEAAVQLYDKLSPFRDMDSNALRLKLGLPSDVADTPTEDYSALLDGV